MLDTKSKSSKKFSFLAAGCLIALAVVIFMAFYPALKKEAANYYTDRMRSDQLLKQFYQSNLVLYKDLLDKTKNAEADYSDLYLVIKEEKLSPDEFERVTNFEEERTAQEQKRLLSDSFDIYFERLKSEILDGIARSVDYCVIDHETGEVVKNTGRAIEALYEDKSIRNEEIPYVYYVMLSYDRAGNLSSVSVRDEKPDELLKSLQSVMAREWLKSDFGGFMESLLYYQSRFYFYEEETALSYFITDKPKDATFIYALTSEQKEQMRFSWNGNANPVLSGYQYEIENAYERAGTATVFWYVLTGLAIAALLMTRNKRYCLHRMKAFHLHVEISLFSITCLFAGLFYLIVMLVSYTNSGFFPEICSRYLEFLSLKDYSMLTVVLNVVVLTVYFGIWYYFITTLGEVFDLGLWKFLKERSLLVKLAGWLVNGFRNRKRQFQEEMLHIDLDGKTEGIIRKVVMVNFLFLAAVCMMWMFGWAALIIYSFAVYFSLKKYAQKIQEQYQKLLGATRSIADGNLQTEFGEDWGIFESYKEELAKIQDGFKKAVEEEVKSQRMRTELLTNVSHDLKTPLTAITTYIELLETENITQEQREEYLKVLKKKSERLKFLIEDLFEVSKAASGNITFNLVDVDICNLIRQVYLEYEDRVEEANLIFRFHMPEEKVILRLDSQKTYRIFENLYTNIIKYAMTGTRVYVNAEKTEKGICIELKNMSATELNIPAEDLTERFVRGDSSRNTEGSGLGLAIATSFVEQQGGKMKVEIDGDLFKVRIEWSFLSK